MRRAQMVERLISCLPIIHRAGVKEEHTQAMMDKINHLDGPGVSKRTKWFRSVEGACILESSIYKDQSPTAWQNLKLIHPNSPDLRALKAARTAIKNAWRSSPA